MVGKMPMMDMIVDWIQIGRTVASAVGLFCFVQ